MAVELQTEGARAGVANDPMLDGLMREALGVPGAGAALLHAFAAQSRALRLVLEAEALGATELPADVRTRLEGAVALTPPWLG